MLDELDTQVIKLDLHPNYGKFAIEPLERGFGHTLGNAFRRVLLTHIPGAAVTDIRVDGAHHEFSTIDGVVEDLTEFVLNLKEVAVKIVDEQQDEDNQAETNEEQSETDADLEEAEADTDDEANEESGQQQRICRISASGPTEVKAADIETPPDVEIMNPELHLAELSDEDANLEVEFWVNEGTGYTPVEEREETNREQDIIPVDANFSPVRRVTFKVEPTRLGRRMDLDRLILEVHGDKTVPPEQAIKIAARILRQYVGVFLDEVKDEEELQLEEGEEEEVSEQLRTPIEEIDFSVRTFNCLKKEDINILGELVQRTEDDLLDITNFGKRSLEEVVEKLQQEGLALAEAEGD